MTVSEEHRRSACDTSVAVAAIDPNHEAHLPARAAVIISRPALAGHAAVESYAVLTRLPLPLRLSAAQAHDVLGRAFPERCWLSAPQTEELLERVAHLGLVGGSVYDALVGWAARADRRVLLTRDRRAERIYRALDVRYELLA